MVKRLALSFFLVTHCTACSANEIMPDWPADMPELNVPAQVTTKPTWKTRTKSGWRRFCVEARRIQPVVTIAASVIDMLN